MLLKKVTDFAELCVYSNPWSHFLHCIHVDVYCYHGSSPLVDMPNICNLFTVAVLFKVIHRTCKHCEGVVCVRARHEKCM
jgi:hypothetical protein